jgi:multicomponent Na+:H+ antiporter subunit E
MITLTTTIALWALYLFLTGNVRPGNLLLGLLLATGVTLLLRPWSAHAGTGRSIGHDLRRLPGALFALGRYLGILFVELVQAGVQVAGIVIFDRPINPGIIAIPTFTDSPLAAALSAHAITLTPGEMVVEMDEGVMYTHCLDVTDSENYVAGAQRMRRDLLSKIIE